MTANAKVQPISSRSLNNLVRQPSDSADAQKADGQYRQCQKYDEVTLGQVPSISLSRSVILERGPPIILRRI